MAGAAYATKLMAMTVVAKLAQYLSWLQYPNYFPYTFSLSSYVYFFSLLDTSVDVLFFCWRWRRQRSRRREKMVQGIQINAKVEWNKWNHSTQLANLLVNSLKLGKECTSIHQKVNCQPCIRTYLFLLSFLINQKRTFGTISVIIQRAQVIMTVQQ